MQFRVWQGDDVNRDESLRVRRVVLPLSTAHASLPHAPRIRRHRTARRRTHGPRNAWCSQPCTAITGHRNLTLTTFPNATDSTSDCSGFDLAFSVTADGKCHALSAGVGSYKVTNVLAIIGGVIGGVIALIIIIIIVSVLCCAAQCALCCPCCCCCLRKSAGTVVAPPRAAQGAVATSFTPQ